MSGSAKTSGSESESSGSGSGIADLDYTIEYTLNFVEDSTPGGPWYVNLLVSKDTYYDEMSPYYPPCNNTNIMSYELTLLTGGDEDSPSPPWLWPKTISGSNTVSSIYRSWWAQGRSFSGPTGPIFPSQYNVVVTNNHATDYLYVIFNDNDVDHLPPMTSQTYELIDYAGLYDSYATDFGFGKDYNSGDFITIL